MEFTALENARNSDAMSYCGRGIFLPQGIFFWSGRAKKEADINATIGSAKGKRSDFLADGDGRISTFYIPSIMKALREVDPEKLVPYAPISGVPRFRDAWRSWIIRKLGACCEFDPALIGKPIAVPGVSSGLAYVSQLFLTPGDTIICHDRKWENYNLMFGAVQGVKVRSVPLFSGSGLDVDSFIKAVRETASSQNPVAVLNFPNNPTGFMPSVQDGIRLRDGLVEVAEETGKKIILIFDDAYDGFVYDADAAQISLFGHFVGAHPGIIPIKCDGTSKEMLMYGARTAAVTFGLHPGWGDPADIQKELDNKVGAYIRGTVSNSVHVFQEVVADVIEQGDSWIQERDTVIGVLADRYRILKSELESADLGGSRPDHFNSGFFCFLNLDVPADDFADYLLVNQRVGLIPLVEPENGINGVRIAFCSVDRDMIPETVSKIAAAKKAFS